MYSECSVSYRPKSREKIRSNKCNKKVSKFRDEDGHIKKEMKECRVWINVLRCNNNISRFCYKELIDQIPKFRRMDFSDIRIEIYHKLKHSLNRNNYLMSKLYKTDGYVVYEKTDICMFLLVLFEAIRRRMINSFLDIPDVFYIVRQIKGVGVNYYFEVL